MSEQKTGSDFAERCKYESEYIAAEMCHWRHERGLTQQQMADTIGVSRAYISQIERSRCKIPVYILKQYCDILNVSPEVILYPDMPHFQLTINEEVTKLMDRLNAYIKAFENTKNN